MKKIVWLLALPIALAACSSAPRSHNAEWDSLKARCVAEDFNACAEIGHSAQQSETVPPS